MNFKNISSPLKFCGSNDYYWINHGRCFLYEEGDEEKTRAGSSGATSKASYIREVLCKILFLTYLWQSCSDHFMTDIVKGMEGI